MSAVVENPSNGATALATNVLIVAYGEPAPGGSKTAGVTKDGRPFMRDSSKRSYPWKQSVAQAAGVTMIGRELLQGPLAVAVIFYLRRPAGHFGVKGLRPSAPRFPVVRPDATKLWRPVEDALTGIVYADDSQIVRQSVWKVYGTPTRVEVMVIPL